MINISQHSVIPISYPVLKGFYNSSGSFISNVYYSSTGKFGTYGCNKLYRALPFAAYGNVTGWDNSSVEPVPSSTLNLNDSSNVLPFNDSYDSASLRVTVQGRYFPYVKYPFLIFYKDNSPVVASLSLRRTFSPDVINDEEEMI